MKRIFSDYTKVHFVEHRRFALHKGAVRFLVFLSVIVFAAGAAALFVFIPRNVAIKEKTCYFLISADYADERSAFAAAEKVRQSGGGGYIINDGIYRVAIFVYPDFDEAQTVKDRMAGEGMTSYIHPTSSSKQKVKVGNFFRARTLRKVFGFYSEAIDKLYSLAIDRAAGSVSADFVADEVVALAERSANYAKKVSKLAAKNSSAVMRTVAANADGFTDILSMDSAEIFSMGYILCAAAHLFTNFTTKLPDFYIEKS